MRPISVLLTNNTLDSRGGTEAYVRDAALALQRRGHRPVAFSLVLGSVAAELRRATIPVLDDLTRLAEPPDVIHGHHHLETLIAALTFPATPIVNFCHGWLPWQEAPLHHPAVRRYVAVDEVCVDRLVREEGIPRSRVELLLNFVDLERFRPRPPLPPRPRRALILSNAVTADGYARAIIAACEAAAIEVDVVGINAGNPSDAPELLVPAYDLVFAKGRTALEALAVGCAVVPADFFGAGPLVTPENYEGLRAHNFGIRALTNPHDVGWYESQIAQYRPEAAAGVSARVRADAGMEPAIDRLIEIYAAAMTSPPGPGDASRAAAIHCVRIARPLKESDAVQQRVWRLTTELESAHGTLEAEQAKLESARATLESAHAKLEMYSQSAVELQHQLAAAHECERQLASARGELQVLQGQVAQLAAARGEIQVLEGQVAELLAAREEVRVLQGQAAQLASTREEELRTVQSQYQQQRVAAHESDRQLAATRGELQALKGEIAEFRALPTLRLRDALLRAPVIGPLLQAGARGLAKRL